LGGKDFYSATYPGAFDVAAANMHWRPFSISSCAGIAGELPWWDQSQVAAETASGRGLSRWMWCRAYVWRARMPAMLALISKAFCRAIWAPGDSCEAGAYTFLQRL